VYTGVQNAGNGAREFFLPRPPRKAKPANSPGRNNRYTIHHYLIFRQCMDLKRYSFLIDEKRSILAVSFLYCIQEKAWEGKER
jgi:hypothetical protein